ncbi:cilia- and flagella-associated protein 100 isoform X2 [Misgurnus anguillicaudatus]|uniref:cilia- and flagella-associated protein 100 isoform X2 n=1 Tax=Misgurnus anguillicaudatus TaxID=75329 RepID=UPI003CCFC6C9
MSRKVAKATRRESLSTRIIQIGSDDANPFRISQHNLLQMMNKDKSRKEQEHQRKLALPVHEKVTLTGRSRARQRLMEEIKESSTTFPHIKHKLQDKSAQRIFMVKDPYIDKRSMNEYITKKRELFLMEYSLAVKRGEIQNLEQMAVEEERKLTSAEKFLEDNTILFEDFLKENDKNSMEAIKMAEQETKMKLDKIAEIKKITSKIVSIKSDISKYEDILREYRKYEEFLLMLSQPERSKSGYLNDMKAKTDGKQMEKTTSDSRSGENQVVHEPKKSSHQSDKIPAPETSDNDKEPELFFTDPEELLNVMAELEEQTLSLIQNNRDAEESLEEFRQTAELTKKKIESESQQLKEQIDVVTDTIQRETQRTAQLEERCKLFGFGKNKPEDQDNTFKSLSDKVEEVYRCCVGETAGNLSTLQMLTSIESKLVELLDNADMIPRDRMTVAERAKEKERRIRLREEKIRLQMIHQEERRRKL